MLTIREATLQDAAALALLGAATMLETYAELITGPDIVAHCRNRHSEAFYADWLATPRITIWIAETPSRAPVGYLVLMPATLPDIDPHPADLEVQRIYVLSRYHASGLGRALIARAIEAAREAGTRQLVLGVLKVNDRAIAFYRRQGFTQIGTRTFQVGASVFDDFVFGRMLEPVAADAV
jgi:ribosomal protein S18 acetylase RimI-like enzyme